jgi:hypothetical protein
MAENEQNDDEQITVTRGQLKAMLAREKEDASMSDDERKVQALVERSVERAFDRMFAIENDDDDDGDGGQRKQSPKGTGKKSGSKSILDSFLGNG